MPNAFASLMLLIWPFVCLVMFRRLSLERAIVWSIVGGYLILPPVAEFDLPLVPSLNKFSIASLSAFLICIFVTKNPVRILHGSRTITLLMLAFVFGAIPTVLTNTDPIPYRIYEEFAPIQFVTFSLPGLSVRDVLSVMGLKVLALLPLLLARSYLCSEQGLREILLGLTLGALFYSLPAFYEVLVQPELNIKIYGFFQHHFDQTIREGGFRPIVFLPHGLWVALFMATALIAAASLARAATGRARIKWVAVVLYLLVVLRACKSLGALTLGVFLTPIILFLRRRTQIRIAIILALIATTYPMLRNLGAIPLDPLVELAESIDPERAQSLGFRFDNEKILLDRANEKPLFGWGGWARNLVFDADSATVTTTPDGNWILTFGQFGWVGYLSQMGLLSLALIMLGRQVRHRPDTEISGAAAAISIILAAMMVDMLLNDTLIPLTWLCAGALIGHVERAKHTRTERPDRFLKNQPVIGKPKDKPKERGVI